MCRAIRALWHPLPPRSDANLHRLLTRLGRSEDGLVFDLGCGFGEGPFPLLEAVPGLHGVGVDGAHGVPRPSGRNRGRLRRRAASSRCCCSADLTALVPLSASAIAARSSR